MTLFSFKAFMFALLWYLHGCHTGAQIEFKGNQHKRDVATGLGFIWLVVLIAIVILYFAKVF